MCRDVNSKYSWGRGRGMCGPRGFSPGTLPRDGEMGESPAFSSTRSPYLGVKGASLAGRTRDSPRRRVDERSFVWASQASAVLGFVNVFQGFLPCF